MVGSFMAIDAWAGVAMIPYLLWVSIAAALTIAVWRRNPRAREIPAE